MPVPEYRHGCIFGVFDMEQIIRLIFYIASGISALMLVFVFLSEIKFNDKKFRWYYYIPFALVNAAIGAAAPYVVINGVLNDIQGHKAVGLIGLSAAWLAALLVNNIVPIFKFRKKEDFSIVFYACTALTGLFILSFWITLIIG